VAAVYGNTRSLQPVNVLSIKSTLYVWASNSRTNISLKMQPQESYSINYWHVIKIIKKSNILVSVALTKGPCFPPGMLIFTATPRGIYKLLNIEYDRNTSNVQMHAHINVRQMAFQKPLSSN
jgi:hypothetical protein